MQIKNRIKDRTKPLAIQAILASVSIREVTCPYQKPVTNTHANTSFLRLLSFIIVTMTSTPQYLDEEQAGLM